MGVEWLKAQPEMGTDTKVYYELFAEGREGSQLVENQLCKLATRLEDEGR